MTREPRMFGLWPSPITPAALAAALRLNEPAWDTEGRTLAWVEGRSDRGVLVARHRGEPAIRDLTPELSVRAFIGYGGGDFTIARGAIYFVAQADQRIYRQELAGGPARPITPPFGAASSPAVSPDGRWVAYVHSFEEVDCIAVVDSEGRQWPARLAEGRDFYMQPCWHPAGDRLAWVEWDHPNMPWDGTWLRLARVDASGPLPRLTESTLVAGGPAVSIFQPAFTRDGTGLLYVSDEPGWGHLFRRDLAAGSVRQLTAGQAEHGTPAWQHGMRTFAELPSGNIAVIRSRSGFHRLVVITPAGAEHDVSSALPGYTAFTAPAASPVAEELAIIASGGRQPPRLITVDLANPAAPRVDVLRRSDSELTRPAALSEPQPVSWTSFDGEEAHGLYYPPASERFEGTGAPPLVVLVHGGPTSQVVATWNPQAQFFATRGYAVLLPNYRGSTGYGRAYMEKLRRSWGIYDVEDARTGALSLAERGLADPSRLVIMGGSAGGFTVLQSLVQYPGTYRAAICMFGVANQFTLAADTHKFEARYLDSLLGPLPEAAPIYRERSPLFHADRIRDPIAVFQGEIDRVVPREQSDSIVASLRARGVPHEYHVYPGEGHGWRKSETIDHFYRAVEAFLRTHVLYA
ncbi:MAG: peptidase [Tepidiforma sp.]|nr:MAG: peptidase [Tepidiforma sp.]